MATILWVHEEFDGPMCGLAEYKDQKVWFSRVDLSSPIGRRDYTLHELSESLLNMVETNHMQYCEITGWPLKHGDPYTFRKNKIIKKDLTGIPEDGVEVDHRSMVSMKYHKHSFDYRNMIREPLIACIKDIDFYNYLVPRIISMDSD